MLCKKYCVQYRGQRAHSCTISTLLTGTNLRKDQDLGPSQAMLCHSIANIEGADSADLPAMISTLSSYDRMFGPRHINTLSLAAHIAEVFWNLGAPHPARSLLERVARDLNESVGRANTLRISALRSLKDLLLEQQDMDRAAEVQTEIYQCLAILVGPDGAETARKAGLVVTIL